MINNNLSIVKKNNVPKQVYQIKITLSRIRPLIWRRILISNYCSFLDFHDTIQECFYWDNDHLHEFRIHFAETPRTPIIIRGEYPDEPFSPEIEEDDGIPENEIRLCDIFSENLKSVKYIYDFGDNWEHIIKLEKIFPNNNDFKSFLCVDGKRAAPPEDSGGPYGYQELLEILKNPKHPEYEEMKEWMDEDFDPEKIQSPMTKMTQKEIESNLYS